MYGSAKHFGTTQIIYSNLQIAADDQNKIINTSILWKYSLPNITAAKIRNRENI